MQKMLVDPKWKAFVRLRRHRYMTDPTFSNEIEAVPQSIEMSLFGVEQKFMGRPRDPLSYNPESIRPPLFLTKEEQLFLDCVPVQCLWE